MFPNSHHTYFIKILYYQQWSYQIRNLITSAVFVYITHLLFLLQNHQKSIHLYQFLHLLVIIKTNFRSYFQLIFSILLILQNNLLANLNCFSSYFITITQFYFLLSGEYIFELIFLNFFIFVLSVNTLKQVFYVLTQEVFHLI